MRIGALMGGGTDDLGRAIATCQAAGLPLLGAMQGRVAPLGAARDAIVLHLLPDGPDIVISEDRGAGATGCRLDPDALARAVAATDAALARTVAAGRAAVLVINRFGKTEAEGRGFRDTIVTALDAGMPVLVLVPAAQADAFGVFAGTLAEPLSADPAAIRDWCASALADATTDAD